MRNKLTWISAATLALGLLTAPGAEAKNVYRWTDDEGKIHYTKSLPPDAATRPYDILSSSGQLLERVSDPTKGEVRNKKKDPEKPNSTGPKPLYSENEKQVIGDRLLLLKYHSEQEIVDAMELEIDHLKYDERLLQAAHDSVITSLKSEISTAADMQRAGKNVPDPRQQNIRQLQKRLVTNRKAHMELNQRKEKIRLSFDTDLQRYRELVALEQAESEKQATETDS